MTTRNRSNRNLIQKTKKQEPAASQGRRWHTPCNSAAARPRRAAGCGRRPWRNNAHRSPSRPFLENPHQNQRSKCGKRGSSFPREQGSEDSRRPRDPATSSRTQLYSCQEQGAGTVQEGHKICDVLKNPPRPTATKVVSLLPRGGGRFKKTTKPATSSTTHFQESYSDQGSPLPLQNLRALAANKVAPLLLSRTGAQTKRNERMPQGKVERKKERETTVCERERSRSRRKIRMESKSRLDDSSRGNDRHGSSCFLELHYRVVLSPTYTLFLSR